MVLWTVKLSSNSGRYRRIRALNSATVPTHTGEQFKIVAYAPCVRLIPSFLSHSLPSSYSSPPAAVGGWRISIAVELTGSGVLIGQRRSSTVAALTCICIAETQPGNTRSILMTSFAPHRGPTSPRCVLKQACSHSENGAGIGERTRASREGEGPLVSKWRERRHFWGRRRVADCAMIYDWHTRTHRKEKETEYRSVLLRVSP